MTPSCHRRSHHPGYEITVSGVEGYERCIYDGIEEFEESEMNLYDILETHTEIMMMSAGPVAVFRWWRLPCKGIGLARMEFIVNNGIKIHLMALSHLDASGDKNSENRTKNSHTAATKNHNSLSTISLVEPQKSPGHSIPSPSSSG
jgi:phosphoenolpyruvate synthase/pyruvate phosphate dikinase